MTDSRTKSIYTTHEVSKLLHVNPRSVINWIDQDLLASYRTPGGHRRIRRDDLTAFLRKHHIPTPAELLEERFNILVVDDEPEIVKIVETYLTRQHLYNVAVAHDGITALIEVGRNRPHLLILDIKIPGVDGVEVCRRIKMDPSNHTAIIAISGEPDVERRVLQAGADAFVPKPLSLERIAAEARRLLSIL